MIHEDFPIKGALIALSVVAGVTVVGFTIGAIFSAMGDAPPGAPNQSVSRVDQQAGDDVWRRIIRSAESAGNVQVRV